MQKKINHFIVLRPVTGLLVILLFSMYSGFSQTARPNRISQYILEKKQTENFIPVSLFSPAPPENLDAFVTRGAILNLDANKLNQFISERNEAITLSFDYTNGQVFELELTAADILAPGFKLGTKGTQAADEISYKPGLYYRGIIKGNNQSVASVSFFNNEIIAVFSDQTGNYNLGQIRNRPGVYILYNDQDQIQKPLIECATPFDMPVQKYSEKNDGGAGLTSVNCKTVNCYFECDFAMYQDFSSNTTTTANYVTGAFNNEATIYFNDGMTIQISQIFVWTSIDPEAAFNSTSTVNAEFIAQTGSTFNGDMAQFLSTRSLGGGIAQGFNGLCNKAEAHSTAGIDVTYANFPVYSWTVMVMAHEMGHLLGSRHTHACVWNGNNTAIDGCSGGVEGGCTLPGIPAGGGTIMSYCHLQGVGINFSLGFGPQPGALLSGNINAAVCLSGSGASTPTGLITTNITNNSATVGWNTVAGALQYTVEFKLTSAGSFTTLGNFTTNTASLTGLISQSSYTWRVQADCSPFATTTFTTTANPGCGVPTGLTTTNIKSTTAKLNWSSFAGATSYKVKYKVFGTTTFKYTTANNAYKSLSNLLPGTKYVWGVKSVCSNGTSTAYTATKTFTTQTITAPSTYCTSAGSNSSLENITNVTFGSINNTSGNNNGYADFTAQTATIITGSSNAVSVGLFKSNSGDLEYVSIWIDFNRDGDFDDSNEDAFNANGIQSVFSGSISVPAFANIGFARMRVSVRFSALPPSCGSYDYGETEDYMVSIAPSPAITQDLKISPITITTLDVVVSPNPAHDNIQLRVSNREDDNLMLEILSLTGQVIRTVAIQGENHDLYIGDLKSGFYYLRLADQSGNLAVKKFIKQ